MSQNKNKRTTHIRGNVIWASHCGSVIQDQVAVHNLGSNIKKVSGLDPSGIGGERSCLDLGVGHIVVLDQVAQPPFPFRCSDISREIRACIVKSRIRRSEKGIRPRGRRVECLKEA